MRDYQRKKNNPYLLPHNLYMQVKYLIRDYDRIKSEYHDIVDIDGISLSDVPIRAGVGDPTARKAEKADRLFDQLTAIEQALIKVPPEYRKGVFDEARYGGGFPIDAAISTYKYWKHRFLYYVAEQLKFV